MSEEKWLSWDAWWRIEIDKMAKAAHAEFLAEHGASAPIPLATKRDNYGYRSLPTGSRYFGPEPSKGDSK